MLNPKIYDEKIRVLEGKLTANDKELKDAKVRLQANKKDLPIAIFANILSTIFIAVIVFLFINPTTRNLILQTFNIDFSNFLDFSYPDTWHMAGVYLGIVLLYNIIICWGAGENYFSTIGFAIFPPLGIYYLCSCISHFAHEIRWAKRQIGTAEGSIKFLSAEIEREKATQRTVEDLLAETNALFEQGKTQNNLQLIQQAADMGNPSAIAYLEELESKHHFDREVSAPCPVSTGASSSSKSQLDDYKSFLEKKLNGTLTREEQDEFDKNWA